MGAAKLARPGPQQLERRSRLQEGIGDGVPGVDVERRQRTVPGARHQHAWGSVRLGQVEEHVSSPRAAAVAIDQSPKRDEVAGGGETNCYPLRLLVHSGPPSRKRAGNQQLRFVGVVNTTVFSLLVSPDAQDHIHDPAPGELELVREFVNTFDLEDGEEQLSTAEALARWLEGHGIEAGTPPSESDLARAIRFREALRGMLLANNGQPLPAGATAELEAAAERGSVRLEVDADGRVSIRPLAGGVDGLLARILEIVARAQVEGTWARLKACPAETCAWAFYDESRNSSRTWCSMGVCGNRAKTRRYRSRRRARPAA
jgi:predicted RNA-binding Zn ribbon-like protein